MIKHHALRNITAQKQTDPPLRAHTHRPGEVWEWLLLRRGLGRRNTVPKSEVNIPQP